MNLALNNGILFLFLLVSLNRETSLINFIPNDLDWIKIFLDQIKTIFKYLRKKYCKILVTTLLN